MSEGDGGDRYIVFIPGMLGCYGYVLVEAELSVAEGVQGFGGCSRSEGETRDVAKARAARDE